MQIFIESGVNNFLPGLKELQREKSLQLGEALSEKEKAEVTDGSRIGKIPEERDRKKSCF